MIWSEDFFKKIIIYATIILLASLLTLFTFDTWETILMVSLLMILVSYIKILSVDKLTTINCGMIKEGFVSDSEANKTKYDWLENDDLFDDFYASVFTKLTQNEKLVQAETALCMTEFKKQTPNNKLSILDAGCGIGIGSCSFVKLGAQHVVGIDKSKAMIQYSKGTTLPSTTLTDLQKQDIEFRLADLIGPGAAGAAEFDAACLLYFTVYYFRDLDMLFRNLHLWVKPNGSLAIEVVNKYKFEPVLDSSNPWVGVSPQRYTKDRITKSKVVFDKFDYEAVFELEDPKAEFRETFRFKDGTVRRQKHKMTMPTMEEIVKMGQAAGWVYQKYIDLVVVGFEYSYLLFFRHP